MCKQKKINDIKRMILRKKKPCKFSLGPYLFKKYWFRLRQENISMNDQVSGGSMALKKVKKIIGDDQKALSDKLVVLST